MFCPNCGKQLPDDTKFCDGCGSSMNGQPKAAPQQTYAAPPPPPPAYSAPPAYQAPAPAYYQQPAYVAPDINAPMRVGQYIGMFLLMMIPLANVILLFVWAFSSDTNINKKNLARAYLILMAIMIGLYIILFIILGSAFASIFSNLSYY